MKIRLMSMPHQICWVEEPGDNVVEHLAAHGVIVAEAEEVLKARFDQREPSRAGTGNQVVAGHTSSGRFLVVVFEYLPDLELVIPVTAYDPTEEGT